MSERHLHVVPGADGMIHATGHHEGLVDGDVHASDRPIMIHSFMNSINVIYKLVSTASVFEGK